MSTSDISADEPTVDANALISKKQIIMSKADVLQKYTQAANLVKQQCPGFKRTESNVIYNLHVDDRVASPLWDSWFAVMAAENGILTDQLTVNKGDDIACRTFFPVFHTDYGCKITDDDIIAAAFCYDLGAFEEIVILFHDFDAPQLQADDFAQIMPAYSEKTLFRYINERIPILSQADCCASLRYYNCELHCVLDSRTNRIVSLSLKTVADAALKTSASVYLTETELDITATLSNDLKYTDFVW